MGNLARCVLRGWQLHRNAELERVRYMEPLPNFVQQLELYHGCFLIIRRFYFEQGLSNRATFGLLGLWARECVTIHSVHVKEFSNI